MPLPVWSQALQAHLAKPLTNSAGGDHSNVTFICRGGEKLRWNGLAYLASLSAMFRPRSGEEQHFTILLPGYGAALVTKLLKLLSTGEAVMANQEVEHIEQLANDLGVRKANHNLLKLLIGYNCKTYPPEPYFN